MRYWTVCDPKDPSNDDFSPIYTTYSEDEILGVYWDYWYERMCRKFGKDHVDKNYSRLDCIQDWVIINWAIPSEEFVESNQ